MSPDGGWLRHKANLVFVSPHLRLMRDEVTGPSGDLVDYDWFQAADQVRVAAIVQDGLLLVDQDHYLIGRSLQLPGGAVEDAETDREAAERELMQETGFHGGTWAAWGSLHPIPALTTARIHLWYARDLTGGPPRPEPGEAGLRLLRLPIPVAAAAVRDGRITCAASAALIMMLSARANA